MTTTDTLKSTETEKILAFKKEFEELMDKHQVTGVLLGLRPLISEIEDAPGKKSMPAFLHLYLKNTTIETIWTLHNLYKKLGNEIREKMFEAAIDAIVPDDEPCDCENCKGQAKADPATAEEKSE